jgi:hypothetical protein
LQNPQTFPVQSLSARHTIEVERTVDVTLKIFKKLLGNELSFLPRFEYILGNAARTLILTPGLTSAELPILLTDKDFRTQLIRQVTNPQVKLFWADYEEIAKKPFECVQ